MDRLLSEDAVAEFLVQTQIPDALVPGEQLEAAGLGKADLDLAQEPGAEPATLAIGPDDQPFHVNGRSLFAPAN